MKRALTVIVIMLLCLPAIVRAQGSHDPGQRDTVIIEPLTEVMYSPGHWSTVNIPVYFVTDNPVGCVNLPITWESIDGQIWHESVIWRDNFLLWDVTFDTVLVPQNLFRILGWHDLGGPDNPPINTNGQRVNVLDLVFVISPTATGQQVNIGTGYDPINGGILFATPVGDSDYAPIFEGGSILYSEAIGIKDKPAIPATYALSQNYPNPFNPQTKIDFALPTESFVSLEIYNILGQNVKTLVRESKLASFYSIIWDGKNSYGLDVPSGVYFYKLIAGDFVQTKKMVMMR